MELARPGAAVHPRCCEQIWLFEGAPHEALVLNHPDAGLVVIRNLSRRIQQLSGKAGAQPEPNPEDRLYEILVNAV